MRTFLDWLYRATGVLAGVFLVLIAALVLAQIVGRLFGVLVPGADVFAVYALIATSFLALAHTLRTGGHIRVALLLRGLNPTHRRYFEIWCLALGAFIACYFTWFGARMVWESVIWGERAIGLVAVPLWLPRTAIALGALVLAISFIDELIRVWRGDPPIYGYRDAAEVAAAEEAASAADSPETASERG